MKKLFFFFLLLCLALRAACSKKQMHLFSHAHRKSLHGFYKNKVFKKRHLKYPMISFNHHTHKPNIPLNHRAIQKRQHSLNSMYNKYRMHKKAVLAHQKKLSHSQTKKLAINKLSNHLKNPSYFY